MNRVPDHVTHYHRAVRPPFLNVSDAPEADRAELLRRLSAPAELARSHRRFGSRYLALRAETEALLRDLFVRAGGRPERTAPHYFVLGSSTWFANLYSDVREVRLPLAALPAEATSITWTDSIGALALGEHLGVPAPPPAHRQRVYRPDDLPDLVTRHGLPADRAPESYEGHQRQPLTSYVEVQLWCDEPVRHLLRPARRLGT